MKRCLSIQVSLTALVGIGPSLYGRTPVYKVLVQDFPAPTAPLNMEQVEENFHLGMPFIASDFMTDMPPMIDDQDVTWQWPTVCTACPSVTE